MDLPAAALRDETDALPEGAEGEQLGLARRPLQPPQDRELAKMTTALNDDCYNMNHGRRGIAYIFNHQKFAPTTGYGERRGTDKDAENLYMVLTEIGFKTFILNDCTVGEMLFKMKEVASEDHSDADCFVCAILSHGEERCVYGYDGAIEMDKLVAPLKGNACKTLAGKPKIFFIQACRGTSLDQGMDVEVADAIGVGPEVQENMEVDIPVVRRIPAEADFFMAYSVVSGFYAWRNMDEGSWFIQAICQVLRENWKRMHLQEMMTRVCRKVAFEFESRHKDSAMSGMKQIPCITSMLTRDVYFTPKK